MMKLVYLASPYMHSDPKVRQHRFEQALKAVYLLRQTGVAVYSPIVHWHPVALAYELPKDHSYWLDQDRTMIDKSNSVLILCIEGWEQSNGIKAELEFCAELNKPCTFAEMEELERVPIIR